MYSAMRGQEVGSGAQRSDEGSESLWNCIKDAVRGWMGGGGGRRRWGYDVVKRTKLIQLIVCSVRSTWSSYDRFVHLPALFRFVHQDIYS